MKFYRIQTTFIKLFSHLFWTYMLLAALHDIGHPIFTSAAVVPTTASTSSISTPSVTSPPYVRKSRDTAGLSPTSAPEAIDAQDQFGVASPPKSGFFRYPSFQHKYQTRAMRFHGEPNHPATRTFSIRSMTSFPKLNPLAGLLSSKSSEMRHPMDDNLQDDESLDPTFTPFISARALSNIPLFFQHLRDNLEALHLDEDEQGDGESDMARNEKLLGQSADSLRLYGNDEEAKLLNIPQLQDKPMRWMPATSGMAGRAHIRHFINDPAEQDLFYRKPGNAYEFGLG